MDEADFQRLLDANNAVIRADIAAMRAEMREDRVAVRAEIGEDLAAMRAEMREDRVAMRAELGEDLAAMRAEMREDRVAVRAEMREDRVAVRAELGEDLAAMRAELREDLATTAAEMRRHYELTTERLEDKIQLVVETVALLDEKVDRIETSIRDEMRRGFADTHDLIRFSYSSLDRRVTRLESGA